MFLMTEQYISNVSKEMKVLPTFHLKSKTGSRIKLSPRRWIRQIKRHPEFEKWNGDKAVLKTKYIGIYGVKTFKVLYLSEDAT